MRILALAILFAGALGAQRGGHFGGGMRGSGHAAGGGFVRGGGGIRAGGGIGFGGYRGGFTGHYGGYRGWRGYGGVGGFGYYRPYRSWGGYYRPYTNFVGGWWSVPYFGFDYYSSPYWGASSLAYSDISPYPYYAPPSVVTVPPPASSPVVIINQEPRRYTAPRQEPEPEPAPPPAPSAESSPPSRSPIYLIAAKDGLIWAAVAYWIENGTLHFINTRQERRQIPLGDVDRALTEQLNDDRRVQLKLPAGGAEQR